MLLRGNMKVLFVLATWIWWTALVGAARNIVEPEHETTALRYTTITLTTDDIDTESYASFLKQVREQLASGQRSFGIPVMKLNTTVADDERFLLLKLANSDTNFITLAMDIVNAYIVAFQAKDRAYFLDASPPESKNLFPETTGSNRVPLTFEGSYIELERVAQVSRSKIPLGFFALTTAIGNMYKWESGSQRDMARGFLVCIQMVSEAARMEYIAQLAGVFTGVQPGDDIIRYETKWSDLSFRIQTADPKTGVFTQRAVELIDANGQPYTVDRVTPKLQEDLSLLLYYNQESRFSQDTNSVEPNDKNMFASVQIDGAQDLCLRANGGGTWLETCDGDAIGQQWAVYADGSIRPRQSQAQCLARTDDTQGCLLQILSCTGSSSNQRWVLKNDGTMFNLRHGLVTAVSNSNIPSFYQIILGPSVGRPNQLKWVA